MFIPGPSLAAGKTKPRIELLKRQLSSENLLVHGEIVLFFMRLIANDFFDLWALWVIVDNLRGHLGLSAQSPKSLERGSQASRPGGPKSQKGVENGGNGV